MRFTAKCVLDHILTHLSTYAFSISWHVITRTGFAGRYCENFFAAKHVKIEK